MSDLLVRIKRAIIARKYSFSEKALWEMDADGITEDDVVESILNAVAIYKRFVRRVPPEDQSESICTSFKALIWMEW